MTLERDYLAGSRIIRWVRAFFLFWRRVGDRITRKMAQDPALSSLSAAFQATPLKVLGILMATAAVTNLVILWLLEKPIAGWGIVLRGGLAVWGVICMRRGDPWEKVRQGSWILRVLGRMGRKENT